jgi:ABC-2 type transport system ATP-binding protein
VILDEPSNGLDPAGIVEMREVLRRLAAMGKTVFVSSHALAEVQQSCDRVAIIRRGELVELSPVSRLLHRSGLFQISVEDPARALQVVRQQRWGAGARIEDGLLLTASPSGRGRELVDFLVAAELRPDSVSEREQSLESIFLELTANGEGTGR